MRQWRQVCLWIFLFAWPTAPQADASGIDFIIYQDGANNPRLMLDKPSNVTEPYRILPADVDELPGYYLTIEPGWDGLGQDQPAAERFALQPGADVALRRVEFDSGLEMYNLDLQQILEQGGDLQRLEGDPETDDFLWHQHLIFAAVPDTPLGASLSATFVVTDESGTYADSDPFTLTFVTALEPARVGSGSAGGGGCGAFGLATLMCPLFILAMATAGRRIKPER